MPRRPFFHRVRCRYSPPDDLKEQLLNGDPTQSRTEEAFVDSSMESGELKSIAIKVASWRYVVVSTSNGRLSLSFVALTLAASLMSVVLSYQAVMAMQRYRWESPRAGDNRIDSLSFGGELVEAGRRRIHYGSYQYQLFSSRAELYSDRTSRFCGGRCVAKELHIAIDFGNLLEIGYRIICEALTTDGQRHRLGLITRQMKPWH